MHKDDSAAVRTGKKPKFPGSIWYIFGNEAAERFSFYGMKAILAIYLAEAFYLANPHPTAQSNATVHLFIAITYFMSILGGFLADWFIGKYKTILWLSIVYCGGHACLAFFDHSEAGFLTGLLLICIGAGGIKPCVSANAGDQFDKSNEELISKMFNIFYLCINIGSVVSILVTPILYNKVGPRLAFGVPGILMAVATFIFWLGRKKYVILKPEGYPKENFVNINFYMLRCLLKKEPGKTARERAEERFSPGKVDGVIAVWRVLAIFAFIPIYWALYDQNGSEWVLQARYLDRHFLGFHLYPSQIQAANPILIITLIPLFTYYVYPFVERVGRFEFTALRKIGTGFFFIAAAFVIIAFLQTKIDAGQHPSIGWQLIAYVLLTISELLVSITGLEYAYTQAPKSMKSTIMAFFLMTVFGGDIFVSIVNNNIDHGGVMASLEGSANYYWFFLGILAVLTVGYIIVAYFIKEKSYLVGTTEEPGEIASETEQ